MKHGVRVKGGASYDSVTRKYRAIFHVWKNLDATGLPVEYTDGETFSTEDAALTHYAEKFRPILVAFQDKIGAMSGVDVVRLLQTRLGE